VPLAIYAIISVVVGLVVCGLMLRDPRKPKSAALAAIVFFGGPPVVYGLVWIQDTLSQTSFEEDVAYVKELCAKNGGDKIYRTVENVEGVFQMRARDDGEAQLRNQFGMVDPWGAAQDDLSDPGIPVGYRAGEYRFVEMQPAPNKSGPPFKRKISVDTGRTWGQVVANALPEKKNEAIWEYKIFTVKNLRSRYGYITEDLSTPEMRRRWIAGGRIKIIDLRTSEVLAERVGYFRAIGAHAKNSWSGASAYQNRRICPYDSTLAGFLISVLRPAAPIEPASEVVQRLTEK
jgi:hypothetical protein